MASASGDNRYVIGIVRVDFIRYDRAKIRRYTFRCGRLVPRYNISHLETTLEVIGSEIIPPAPAESSSSYIRYGMDRIRLPGSFIQSKRAYGQDGHIIAPTEYPVPEKQNTTIEDAENQIRNARKEHPEWLTDIKGFAQ